MIDDKIVSWSTLIDVADDNESNSTIVFGTDQPDNYAGDLHVHQVLNNNMKKQAG